MLEKPASNVTTLLCPSPTDGSRRSGKRGSAREKSKHWCLARTQSSRRKRVVAPGPAMPCEVRYGFSLRKSGFKRAKTGWEGRGRS